MKQRSDNAKWIASLYEWIEAIVFSLIIIVLVFTFICRIVRVDGTSMENTLIHNDRLLLFNMEYTPDYGDVVVIVRDGEEPLIKRVIAMEGDTVEIVEETAEVIVNGQVLDEPYVKGITVNRDFYGEQKVPDGCLFVMGDHRTVSHDSRSEGIGFVSVKDVMGQATFRIWPLSKFGPVQ